MTFICEEWCKCAVLRIRMRIWTRQSHTVFCLWPAGVLSFWVSWLAKVLHPWHITVLYCILPLTCRNAKLFVSLSWLATVLHLWPTQQFFTVFCPLLTCRSAKLFESHALQQSFILGLQKQSFTVFYPWPAGVLSFLSRMTCNSPSPLDCNSPLQYFASGPQES